MQETEILSPAGNIQSVHQAVQNGADAVYIGGKNFGARAFAANFSYTEMKQAIDYAHTYGVKVYVTVNTLVFEEETSAFLEHVQNIYILGADALIMQDVGMITAVKQCFPDIDIHASTQMHNHNDACLWFVYELGATRAVLAREMSLEQIKSLTCGIEKEVFIHGALCICYSGQCLFSALTKDRSANRGKCAQSCRMKYTLLDSSGRRVGNNGDYILSPKDLALLSDISLIGMGIQGLKIEGRMKSSEYVGIVTKIYTNLFKQYRNNNTMRVDKKDIDNLKKLFNRGFTKGHLLEKQNEELMGTLRPNHKGVFLGQVVSCNRDRIKVKLSATLSQGDGIKFEKSDAGFICNKIYKNGLLVSAGVNGDLIELDNKARVIVNETVVKTSDVRLIEELQDYAHHRKVEITGSLNAKKGETLCLKITDADGHSVIENGDVVQQSLTSPTTKENFEDNLSKLGDTPYVFGNLKIDCDENIFVAKRQINFVRREAVQKLTEQRTLITKRRAIAYMSKPVRHCERQGGMRLHVLVRTSEQFEAIKDLATGDIYTSDISMYDENKQANNRLRYKTDKLAKTLPPYTDERLLVTDHGGVHEYHRDNDIVLDYSLNVLNSYTLAFFTELSARRITLSPEMNTTQIGEMIKAYQKTNGQTPVLEAVVYARHELMAIQHCVIRNAFGKEGKCGICKNDRFYIEDISGNRFPIMTDERCNNYILDCKYYQSDVPTLMALGIQDFRIELFDQDALESERIIKKYLNIIDK